MTSSTITRTIALATLATASIALAMPPFSHASQTATEGPPAVSTGKVSQVLGSSAVLEGTINPHKLATTYYFQYGPTAAYGSQTPTGSLPAGGSEPVKVSHAVSGLLTGDHYRLVASNSAGSRNGKDRTFTVKQKTKKSEFELPKSFEPTIVGGAFTISGTLTGTANANREIVLQASPYPYRVAFADVGAPIFTSAHGSFTARVARLLTGTRFRLATVGTPVVLSKVVTEQVQVRVSLKVRTTSRAKGLVRLYGTVSPAEVGAHVFFQLESTPKPKTKLIESVKPEKAGKAEKEEREEKPRFSSKFSSVVKQGTSSLSRFSAVLKIQETGHYRVFVEVPPGPLASGHSQTVLLHAGKTKKKKS